LLGQKYERGGDVSQLGFKRLTLDEKMRLLVGDSLRAYFQPKEFSLGVPNAVAARVTVKMPSLEGWSEETVKSVQEALVPSAEMTAFEVDKVVRDKMGSIAEELTVWGHILAAFVNANASGSDRLKSVLESVVGGDLLAVDDMKTTRGGADNEELPALTPVSAMKLTIEDLTVISEVAGNSDPKLNDAIAAFFGVQYLKIAPRMAVAFEPFASAVEKARLEKDNSVDANVASDAVNYLGLVEEMVLSATLKDNVVVEIVRCEDVQPALFEEFVEHGMNAKDLGNFHDFKDDIRATTPRIVEDLRPLIKGFKAMEGIDWIASRNGGDDDSHDIDSLDSIGKWEVLEMSKNGSDDSYLAALAKYALAAHTLNCVQKSGAPTVGLVDFAVARMNIINHNLIGESREVLAHSGMLWGALSLARSVALLDGVCEDVVGQVQHAASHVSFMKSGHHASANNIGNTLVRLMEAVDIPYDISDLPERLAFGTYYGTKPADQRAVAVFLRYKYAQNELSFAIGRRLNPNGPGTVSMHLLSMVMEQLHHAKFFKFLEREEQYNHFMAVYNQYKLNAHLEVPYAQFFYGESKAESVLAKQSVSPMYAYAAALGSAMPNSTFAGSVALNRDASAAANNTITAVLEVKSFVVTYQGYLKTIVKQQLVKSAKIKTAAIMPDEGEAS